MLEPDLEFGTLPKAERTANQPRHILALSGGGFRGLFTARVISALEQAGHSKLGDRFDLIAGTSVGGILAIGIGMGIAAGNLVKAMGDHGPSIFTPDRFSFGGYRSARYRSDKLKEAIVNILGSEVAEQPFRDIPAPLLVIAVDDRTSEPKIFRTNLAAEGKGDKETVLDVALATSAAPTFFPPHTVGGAKTFVDGGIIANAPDITALAETMRLYSARLEDIHLCSIGTAGSPRVGAVKGNPGKLHWARRYDLIALIMDAQVALANHQIEQLRPASVLRIDERPARPIALDDASDKARAELEDLADKAARNAEADQAEAWARYAAHVAIR